MAIYFITSNKHKLAEFKEILAPQTKIEQKDIELDEIQSLNPQEVIKHKLNEATKKFAGEFLVEDTSFYLDALNGLPGPLTKWFVNTLGREKIYQIVKNLGDFGAEARTVIGYTDGKKVHYFEGIVKGNLCEPEFESAFGFDPIFVPEGQSKSYAEMGKEEKNKISQRKKALEKFKEWYLKNK
jgi:XTP/dITP diphosphohydrolase